MILSLVRRYSRHSLFVVINLFEGETQKKKSGLTHTSTTLTIKRGPLVVESQRPSINPSSLHTSISKKHLTNTQAHARVSSGTSSKLQPAVIHYSTVKQPVSLTDKQYAPPLTTKQPIPFTMIPPCAPVVAAKEPPQEQFKIVGTKPSAGVPPSQATPERPDHPFVTPNIPICLANNGKHSWSIHANKYYRGYTCKNMSCGVDVKEYKTQDGRGWVSQTEKKRMDEGKADVL